MSTLVSRPGLASSWVHSPKLFAFLGPSVKSSDDDKRCDLEDRLPLVLVVQSCLTLYNPMDSSPPHSSVHGILQARTLEWVVISFSRGSSQPRDQTGVSCIASSFLTVWVPREVQASATECVNKTSGAQAETSWDTVTTGKIWEQFFLLRNESSGIIEPDREQIDPTYTHTSWQIDGETMKTVTDFIFLGSTITATGDCSHEIKRHLLLGRKTMTNIDIILKSRTITVPTKVCLVKAMVFPVIMYGCESWTIKLSTK